MALFIKPTLRIDGALPHLPGFCVFDEAGNGLRTIQGDTTRDGAYANASALARATRLLKPGAPSFFVTLARNDHLADMIESARDLLGLPYGVVSQIVLDATSWRRADIPARLVMLADWLRAEIFEEIDRESKPVNGESPIDVAGTND